MLEFRGAPVDLCYENAQQAQPCQQFDRGWRPVVEDGPDASLSAQCIKPSRC